MPSPGLLLLCLCVSPWSAAPGDPAPGAPSGPVGESPLPGGETDGSASDGQETLVTARKQSEPLADLPGSATVIDAEELRRAELRTVTEAARRVPNMLFSEFTARRLAFPFVRGIGSGLNDPAVITYVDDVPQFGFGGTNLPLFEVESLEFLRGPQGTLYGRNALGGLIHVHSARPSPESEWRVGAGYGSYDERELSLTYSGPLAGAVSGRLGVLDTQRDGYTKNLATGHRVDDRDSLFGRARVLYAPSSDSELELSFFGERARDGGFGLNFLQDMPLLGITGLDNRSHQINQDFEGDTSRDVLSPSVVYRILGDGTDFTSISAYERWRVRETSDFDFTPIDGVRRRAQEEQSYFYQELRLGTSADRPVQLTEGTDLHWLLGLSGFLSDSSREAANNFRPGGEGIFFPVGSAGIETSSGDFQDVGLALFGQARVVLEERVEFTLGLRGDLESKEVDRLRTFTQGGFTFPVDQGSEDKSFSQLVPLLALAYHVDEKSLLYVQAAGGFKAGGFNLAAPGQTSFDPEKSWSYELGYRTSFADGRYRLGAALFQVDWSDMQLSLFDPLVGGYIDNVGESTSRGVELEGSAGLVEGLDGFASLGILDTEIDEFVDPFGNDTSGNSLPFAPDSTWSLGLQYGGALPSTGSWYLRGDYTSVGDFFYDAGNLAGDSYGLVNLQAGVVKGSTGLSLWVRNAFDEEYVPVAFQPSPVDPSVFVGESGAPRVIGFTLSFNL